MTEKKELMAESYVEIKKQAQELDIQVSRPGGGGRRSKEELVDLILEAEAGDVALEDMSKAELKALCKEEGLSIKGNKSKLIDRLEEALYEDDDEDDDDYDEEEEDWEDEEVVELTEDDLMGMNKAELKDLCSELGLAVGGTKAVLVERILDSAEDVEDEDDEYEDEDDEEEEEDALEDLTRKELKALAGSMGLPKSGSKAALITRIQNHEGEDDDEDDEEDGDEADEPEGVSGGAGPVEGMLAGMQLGTAFIVTRVSDDKWVVSVPSGATTYGIPVSTSKYDAMSRAELKDLLRERGLKIGGRKTEQVTRLVQFDQETAGTDITKKYRGRALKEEVYSDEFKKFQKMTRSKSYKAVVKAAKKAGAKWDKHTTESIDRIRATQAWREELGIEKYKEQYATTEARKAITA